MANKINLHTNLKLETFDDMIPPKLECFNYFSSGDSNSKIQIFEDVYYKDHVKFDRNEYIKIAFYKENPDIYEYTTIFSQDSYNPYEYLLENHGEFDYIISAFKHLEAIVGKDKFIYCPVLGSRIELDKYGVYEKSKMLSIVASSKDWAMGHRLRHWVIKTFKSQLDIYGNGYNDLIDRNGKLGKIYSLAPYYFSLAIMNSKHDGYFTEVLTDCIATGTVPLWYGANDIGTYFNPDGIIKFNTLEELNKILPTLSKGLYDSKLGAIQENLEIAREYLTDFDYLHDKHFEFFNNLEKK
tara:strand:- start:157 stop:1047 length:891 start_codon:yes stop_codon:yes gene_type:complete